MALADKANQYIDEKKPWALAKDPANRERRCSGVFRRPEPVPAADCLSGNRSCRPGRSQPKPFWTWPARTGKAAIRLLLNHRINPFTPLMTRIEKDKVQAMVDASKENLTATAAAPAKRKPSPLPAKRWPRPSPLR
jgi:methionyl-tRNA synthetase